MDFVLISFCLKKHPNIWWFKSTEALQANHSQSQLDKGVNNRLHKTKNITRRENPNSSQPSWKTRKKHPKGHTKNRSFVFCTISNDRICHILSSRVEPSEQGGFDYDG